MNMLNLSRCIEGMKTFNLLRDLRMRMYNSLLENLVKFAKRMGMMYSWLPVSMEEVSLSAICFQMAGKNE